VFRSGALIGYTIVVPQARASFGIGALSLSRATSQLRQRSCRM